MFNYTKITCSEYKTLSDVCLGEIVVYALVMVFIVHNIYFYMIKIKRY